jgi:erythrin-vacuolar iron transport family protein
VRQLLGDLASEESKHYDLAEKMDEKQKASGASNKENESERRRFVLQIVQPGLAGLMDGSVSTLAPVFAAAFATHKSKDAFLVGMAASVGAGISMGFAEAMSAIVAVELAVIAWIRHRYMDTPLLSAAFQVIVGGVLVFIVGIVIGSA